MSGGRIERLQERLDDGRFLCVFLLVGADGAVLVDTGLATTPQRTIAPALARLGIGWDGLRAVVVTHADVDHAGGLGAVRRLAPRATVVAGAADRLLIESSELLLERRYREFRDEHGIDQPEAFSAWVRANADDGAVDLALTGDGTLRIDREWTVGLLAAPGHTAGHLVVHDPASATVIAADAVLGGFSPGAGGEPAFAPTYRFLPGYRETIARLQEIAPQRLLCSHLPPLEGAAVAAYLRESAAFADRCEAALLRVLDGGEPATLAELIAATAPALASWPAAARDTLVQPLAGHLEALSAQGRVRRLPGCPARYART
ncbi:MBL fold metallo-hydrolase [Conexibacter sp. JD483]|uniref:MBL fold metallo-hydrolase n=1 Tax=unclassified Conexibacter TaxID=2627773 RepID=UPI0027198285|nr:MULTISPECIES: MBL fold metallo-hydrolase [unclassified Conexibacter]MDO8186317.1 MBL fold metallo-hydrolase [Conexibacter sp. CPCC 205706]MDO8197522.1 MBL fold metallo-hydrolase [Conexibacter sp. CPCC 205762]MDR9369656.1 MBL fold metallo-hydrolase [Conexibacter sp. JD483]